jgi:hypothetical protein
MTAVIACRRSIRGRGKRETIVGMRREKWNRRTAVEGGVRRASQFLFLLAVGPNLLHAKLE